jgi:hypothetical protein
VTRLLGLGLIGGAHGDVLLGQLAPEFVGVTHPQPIGEGGDLRLIEFQLGRARRRRAAGVVRAASLRLRERLAAITHADAAAGCRRCGQVAVIPGMREAETNRA